ncbi:putative spermidine/putrescine transport system permease protein [Methylobacterium sp. 275MFSha3.1]|uniref:ABC transporter permease n=1 Tax=Methylobacterium sp. 275MFSha3.1 TaxID=1502746 RepID=UPI0008A751E2|nr:ABC transporter permease [Methylobacterium sp. 275MFSha3.1]SEH92519.1 putative spermidine/putrescine transport system permease protein [Methylobacterium sp. 275MFSha3.1]
MSRAGIRRTYGAISGAVLAFIVLPLVVIVWVSFFANRILAFPASGYTLDWYARALETDVFRDGFVTSVETALFATAASLALGVPASLGLVRGRFPGRDAVQALLLAPMVVPGIVGGAALFIAFIEVEALLDIQVAGTLGGLLAAHTLIALPWTIRLVSASLASADRAIEEAAASLGADPLTVLRRVTLPAIRPAIVAAALFSFVISFIDLEKSIFLVGPGRTTLQIALVNYLEWNLDGTVAAVAAVQILIVGTALLVSDRYARLAQAF